MKPEEAVGQGFFVLELDTEPMTGWFPLLPEPPVGYGGEGARDGAEEPDTGALLGFEPEPSGLPDPFGPLGTPDGGSSIVV